MAGCPEALAWDDADIYTCFWCVWPVSGHSANDWSYWEKRCCSRPGSSMQMLFVFSSALLVALPQHACRYRWLLRGAPINCKELLQWWSFSSSSMKLRAKNSQPKGNIVLCKIHTLRCIEPCLDQTVIHVCLQNFKLSIVTVAALTISHCGVFGVSGVSVVSAVQHPMAALQEPGFLVGSLLTAFAVHI